MKRVRVERHPLAYRVLHWLIVAEMALLLLTGLSVSETLHLPLLARGLARSLHVVVAFAWLATITVFLYYFILSGEYRWFGLRRLGEGVDALVEEIRAVLRGEPVQEPIRYDPKRGEYIEKIYPTEVLAWWGWALLWTLLAFTGLGLVFPDMFGFVNRFWHAILPDFGSAAAASRRVHLVASLLVVAMVLVHGYLVILTGVWRSMIWGTREEPVAEAAPAAESEPVQPAQEGFATS